MEGLTRKPKTGNLVIGETNAHNAWAGLQLIDGPSATW